MPFKAKPLTLNQIADRVAILETSSGKNDKCKREGLGYNSYGYGQQINKYTCFDTDKRAKQVVMNWFASKLTVMSLEVALCHYNIGHKISNCDYAKKFKSL